MRILITGSRNWIDEAVIADAIVKADATEIIHGGARGADSLAGKVARDMRLPCTEYIADWKRHGRAAGSIRNQRMLNEGKPDLVLAFPLEESRGTWDMVRRAKRANVQVRIIWECS